MAQTPLPPKPQSTPAVAERPRLADYPWLIAYSVRGLAELARARIAFARFKAKHIAERNRRSAMRAKAGKRVDSQRLDRIAYVLPRLSDRLPWRSDCVVQAIAGQNWLSALGAQSAIQIGVENPADGQFGAHAWLEHDGRIITGGNVDQYRLILDRAGLSQTEGADSGESDDSPPSNDQ